MRIKEIMTADVISASPDDSIVEVADLIFKNRFHGVPVAYKGKLVGIVTEDDFFLKDGDGLFLPSYLQFLKESKASGILPEELKNKIEKLVQAKVKDIMTEKCRTVSEDMYVMDLMNIINETKFTTFPVIDSANNLIGIVTLSDVLGTVKNGANEMREVLLHAGGRKQLHESIRQMQYLWKDKVISISKKKVRTWKGGLIIASFIAAASIFLWISANNNKTFCGLVNQDSLSITCQKFEYSPWSECRDDGTRERKVISRLPEKCDGGAPILVQKCP